MLFHLHKHTEVGGGVEVFIRLIALLLLEDGCISGLRHARFILVRQPGILMCLHCIFVSC